MRDRTNEYRQNAYEPIAVTREGEEPAPGVTTITVYNWSLSRIALYMDGVEIFSGEIEPTRGSSFELESGLYDVFVGEPSGARTPAWRRESLAGTYSVDITTTHQGEQAAELGMHQRPTPAIVRTISR